MIYDITQELRDFTYITSVYKCIAAYNLKGHQIGRKIGDMLEILTMGGVYQNPALLSRLDTEGKLEGYTTAGHKVEFGFYKNVREKQGLFGAVECKCVGVEETTAGKGQNCLRKIKVGESFSIDFNGRWMNTQISHTIKLLNQTADGITVELTNSKNASVYQIPMKISMCSIQHRMATCLKKSQDLLGYAKRLNSIRLMAMFINFRSTTV